MKVTETSAVMMLAVLKNGEAGTGPEDRCGFCRRYKTEFVASPGLRARARDKIGERTVVCTNADTPCPMAIKAKPVLDALREAAR